MRVTPRCMRRTDPLPRDDIERGGVIDLVAENVLALDFTYFDGEYWTEDWPAYLEDLAAGGARAHQRCLGQGRG